MNDTLSQARKKREEWKEGRRHQDAIIEVMERLEKGTD